MTAEELFEIIEDSDRVRVIREGGDVFVGFLGVLRLEPDVITEVKGMEVKKFRAVPEITHRRWKELNLRNPLLPEETPDFIFSDLQTALYYTIYI